MREIKFRAWDKRDKKMRDHNDIYLMGGEWKVWDDDESSHSNIELLQYTGLKDKNGKEIYEGDILKIRWPVIWYDEKTKKDSFEEQIYTEIVSFNEKIASFCLMGDMAIEHMNPLETAEEYKEQFWWEVIGNIYEDKKLIK